MTPVHDLFPVGDPSVPRVVAPGLTASEGALELVPIPATMARLADDGRVVHEYGNRAFARACLGEADGLDAAIAAFLRDGRERVQSQVGENPFLALLIAGAVGYGLALLMNNSRR